ncbi:MAG: hypothetical protein KDD89_09740, partial [Anaerolineales bacterium]|nr:hypothetical protein [Anaerolineales bacterium]
DASLASLDIIGFDACLMNQLDVLTAVAPYAHIAVASSELTPGTGWDYERLLRALYDAPQQTPPELAQTMVDSFMAYYTQDAPNDFVSLTAVDLTQLTAVTTALETLSQHLQADLPFNAPALADARHGAASDLWITADNRGQGSYTAVDMRDMADILASRSFDPAVISAAQELVTTLDTAVLAHGRGRGLPQNNGLALYFPASASSLDPRYQSESQLATWPTLLSNFYLSPTAVSANAALYPPTLDLINSFPEADANVLNPVHLAFQLTGRDLADVHILAGQFTEDGRRRLLEYDRLIPQPTYLPNGRELLTWRDGRHTDFYIWQTRATVLTDGTNRDFAILWPTGNERTLRRVPGLYTTAVGETLDAHLLFNRTNRSLATVWAVGPNGEPFEQTPASGDLFAPYRYYLDESDQLQVETGATFSVTTAVGDPLLRYDWQPVPDGNYFLGLKANNRADDTVTALTNIAVTNEQSGAATAEQFAYLDPYLGFQFPYPADWYRPVYGENGLYTTNTDGTAQLQLALYPDTAASRPTELQADVLARFGQVDLLYEQDTAVGINPTIPAVMTAYGYNSGSGERTGLLVSFIYQGQGYVLDLDAPATAEPQAIALIDSITRNWQFRPLTTPQAALFPNNWNQVTLGEVAVPQRSDFRTQTAGAWERLAANDDPRIFMALQTHPLPTGAEPEAHSLADSLLYWSEVASQGVSGYRAGQLGRFVLANQLWVRQEFRYVDEAAGEEIWGFVMVTHVADREVIAWAESPAAVYNEVNGKVFETMLAE